MRGSSEKVEIVQALRGVAALLVVFWHASRYFGPYGTGWAAEVFQPGAWLGVDLFFAISGFIMVLTTGRSDGTVQYAANFMVKRITRIWPPYAVATLLFIILIPYHRGVLGDASGWSRLLHSLLFIPRSAAGEVAPVFDYPLLPVGWSLNYEMYFYTAFGFSLLFGRARWVALMGLLGIPLFLLPLGLGSDHALSIDPSTNYGVDGILGLMSNPLILLFAGGCIIGLVYRSSFAVSSSFWLGIVMWLSVTLAIWQHGAWFRVGHGLTRSGLSAIPLLFVFCIASKTMPLKIPRGLIFLGDISFSLYILHPLAQEGFDVVLAAGGIGAPSGWSAFLGTTGLAVAVAAVSHRYLEVRLSAWLRQKLLMSPSFAPYRSSLQRILAWTASSG